MRTLRLVLRRGARVHVRFLQVLAAQRIRRQPTSGGPIVEGGGETIVEGEPMTSPAGISIHHLAPQWEEFPVLTDLHIPTPLSYPFPSQNFLSPKKTPPHRNPADDIIW